MIADGLGEAKINIMRMMGKDYEKRKFNSQ